MPTYEPELGQGVFGAAWGRFDVSDLGCAALQHVLAEIARVYWNRNQQQWDDQTDPGIPGIAYRPYYWGECTCGYDEAETAWDQSHHHTLACYQTELATIPLGTNSDDPRIRTLLAKYDLPLDGWGGHCTCTHRAEWAAWSATHQHQPNCLLVLPNLACADVEIRWYKHARRGLSVNRDMTPADWNQWLEATMALIQATEPDPDVF